MSRRPQHSEKAERSVLAAILLHPTRAFEPVAEVLPTEDDFYLPGLRAAYKAMLGLASAGDKIDPITLEKAMEAAGDLGLIGGLGGIGELADSYASVQHAERHAQMVADLASQRRLVSVGQQLADEGLEPIEDVCAWGEEAEKRVAEAVAPRASSNVVAISDIMHGAFAEIIDTAKKKGEVTGVDIGFPSINRLTGGLQPGDLVIVGARPSMGKTAIAMQWAVNGAAKGFPALVFSVEMSQAELVKRMVSTQSKIDNATIRDGRLTDLDMEALVGAAAYLHGLPIAIDDKTHRVPDMCSAARRWAREQRAIYEAACKAKDDAARAEGREPQEHPPWMGAVYVDYLQLAHGGRGKKYESKNIEVSEHSRDFKLLAKAIGCPVVVLSQLNRGVDSRSDHRPTLSDLRDSGAIEQDADKIFFPYRASRYVAPESMTSDIESRADLIFAKHRQGPVGTIPMHWRGATTSFHDIKRSGDDEQ